MKNLSVENKKSVDFSSLEVEMGCLKLKYCSEKEVTGVDLVLKKGVRGKNEGGGKSCAGAYSFGFQGQEKDDEVKGTGNSYDFGARIYDPRVGRWLSIDPLFYKYPPISPYVFGLNNPIYFIDPEGACVVGPNGECVDIQENNGSLVINGDLSEDATDLLNAMWKTKTGKKQVRHLIKTKAKVTLVVSEDIGIGTYKGKHGVLYGLTGPQEGQSDKLVKDYDGGKVYEENTLILFKGSLKYGKGDKSALEEGNITLVDFENRTVTKVEEIDESNIAPFQNPDKLYKNEEELYNLGGVHETEHTKSENIKLRRDGKDAETPAYKMEDKSREEMNDN